MRWLVLLLSCCISSPALALCSQATLNEDYRQADIVVRAIVTAETLVADEEPDSSYLSRWGSFSPVSLHRLRVIDVFKGRPGPTINLFQEVNSGRFAVGLDEEVLLFLSYHRPDAARPSEARGAMFVRHTCGQSKAWNTVTAAEIARLRALNPH